MAIESRTSSPLELRQGGRAQDNRSETAHETNGNEIYLIERQAIELRRHRWMQAREKAPPAQAQPHRAAAPRPETTQSTLPDDSALAIFERPRTDSGASTEATGFVARLLYWLRGSPPGQ